MAERHSSSESPHEDAERPASPPLHMASVWECRDLDHAAALLGGDQDGYVYQRNGHPNADWLARELAELHVAEFAFVTGSGMAALAAALAAYLQQGDEVLLSNRVYGCTTELFVREAARWGIRTVTADLSDRHQVEAGASPRTRLIVAETIANPTLEVVCISTLRSVADECGALLLIDNTFATPAVCRPLECGAHLVMESLSKLMNGHSDVMLGALAGREVPPDRLDHVIATWGWTAAPFACWLVQRSLASLALRAERACENAQAAAEWLSRRAEVERVHYPGLKKDPSHAAARAQFHDNRFGYVVTFQLPDRLAAERFIRQAVAIPFCPSLGEARTTLSHPASTSHRGLSAREQAELGIHPGTIRLSAGIESGPDMIAALEQGLSTG